MIGITESGSTKAQWTFVNGSGKSYTYLTKGFNPFYQTVDQIRQTVQDELLPAMEFNEEVDKIYFYGAGCEAEVNKVKMKEALSPLLPSAKIEVWTDLIAAAKALFGDKPGIACIAGTGSNTCHYDGSRILANVQSLGLFLGDEGSGGYKGKLLLKAYLRQTLPAHLIRSFETDYEDRLPTILGKIYGEPMPNRYIASFTPFLIKHLEEPEIYKLVYQSFDDLFVNCILKYDKVHELPLGFAGSVAYHFREVLEKVAESKDLKIAVIDPSPSGALVKYHLEKDFA